MIDFKNDGNDRIGNRSPARSPGRPRRKGSFDAVGYVRVSTRGQAAEGVSLDAQRLAIQSEAERRGLRLLEVFADEGVSGRSADRAGLRQALELAKSRRATLIVYSLSRFARSAADALALIGDLDRAGASFASTSEAVRTSDACGRMVLGMLAVVAQFEAEIDAERTRDALAHLRATGRKTGGSVPFGFTVDAEGRLVEDEVEQGIIGMILQLRNAGFSLRVIVGTLNAEKVPTRTRRPWQLTQVARIVKREQCADCGF